MTRASRNNAAISTDDEGVNFLMKIPYNELKALFDWSTAKLARIEGEHPPIRGALDSRETAAQKAHIQEYNRRILELHKKYEQTPVVKSQTFNQLR